jgi:hypothetical protein
MGLIICEKHGETGFISHVSKELSLGISAGNKFSHDKVTYIDVILVDDEDGEVLSKIRYWMTQDCFKSLSALKKYTTLTEEDEEKVDRILIPIMQGGGCCGKCFDEHTGNIRIKHQQTA